MLLLKGKRAHFPWKGILLWKPNSNFNFLVNNTIKHLSARSNILQLWWNFFRSFCNTVIRHIWYGFRQVAHYLYWPFSKSVDCCQVLYLLWQKIPNDDWEEWGASIHMIIMWGKLYQLSTPYIKLSVSISQQSKGICSLSKQLSSNRLWYYLLNKLLIMHVKAHMLLNKHVCTFCILTSCVRTVRTDGLKLFHTA